MPKKTKKPSTPTVRRRPASEQPAPAAPAAPASPPAAEPPVDSRPARDDRPPPRRDDRPDHRRDSRPPPRRDDRPDHRRDSRPPPRRDDRPDHRRDSRPPPRRDDRPPPRRDDRPPPRRDDRDRRREGEQSSPVWQPDRARRDMRPPRPGGDGPRPAPTPELVEDRQFLLAARSGVGPGGYLRFSDIPAHKLGRAVRGKLYELANGLAEDERSNLVQRIKAAATTVTAALAAAFGESLFRATVQRTLESRGALFSLLDHLEQLLDLGRLDAERFEELKAELERVVQALNEFLGQLAREREQASKA